MIALDYGADMMAYSNLLLFSAWHAQFIEHLATHQQTSFPELLQLYPRYETELRNILAAQPGHEYALKESNVVPIFIGRDRHPGCRGESGGMFVAPW